MGVFKTKHKKVEKQILMNFTLGLQDFVHEFLLINDLNYPVILGIDFLRRFNASLDLKNKYLVIFKNNEKYLVPEIPPHPSLMGPEKVCARMVSAKNYDPEPPSFLSVCKTSKFDMQLAEVISACHLSEREKEIFSGFLSKHQAVFSEVPGLTHVYEHGIQLKNETEFFIRPYPIPFAHRDAVNSTIADMEKWGIIERANTPYISPLCTVVKRDGTVRVCLDARHLNSILVKDFELPGPIEDILRGIPSTQFMSTLDLTMGYWQIPLKKEARKYTGFMVGTKTFQFKVLPFGLSNAVSSFTRCLDLVFGHGFSGFLVKYLDDVLTLSPSFEAHLEHLQKIFDKLREVGLKLNLKKCRFFRRELKFLGYVLNQQGFRADQDRIQAIVDYAIPTSKKEIQKFLGLVNFDRSFCPHLAETSEPLTRLLRKDVKWFWGEREQGSFDEMKKKLAASTLLYYPDFSLPFYVSVDSSNIGLGAELYQIVKGEKRVVAWASRLLLPRESRYHSNELEALAVVWALKKWRTFLLGKQFFLRTDNRCVTYLNTCRLLSPRISRWALSLQEYDFVIQYIPGPTNVVADALSRFSCSRLPCPDNRCFRVLNLSLPNTFLKSLDNISQAQKDDPKLNSIREGLSSDDSVKKRFLVHNDILYIRHLEDEPYRLCVPKKLVVKFCEAYHVALGHFGAFKTWHALKSEVWWTNMYPDIKRITRSCDICQKSKCVSMPKVSLHPMVPETKGDLVALDLYGPLVKSRGGATYLLVVLDVFTKFVALYPIKRATTRAVLNRLTLDYFPMAGKPSRILTDHGTQFTAKTWRSTLEALGVRLVFSSVRHPQANSSERVMRELGRLFRAFCWEKHSRWAFEVRNFGNILNNVVHESTGFTPNELHFGKRQPRLLPANLQAPIALQREATSETNLILAKETLMNKASRRAVRFPGRPYPSYKEGDLVLLRANNISSTLKVETKKFLLLFEGPYRIKKQISFATFILSTLDGKKERGSFHVNLLRPFHKRENNIF